MKLWSGTGTVLLLLTGCFTTAGPTLSASELPELVMDKSFAYSGRLRGAEHSGKVTFHMTGTLDVRTNTGDEGNGTWRIFEDKVCVSLADLRGGKEFCSTVAPADGGGYLASYGFTLTPRSPIVE